MVKDACNLHLGKDSTCETSLELLTFKAFSNLIFASSAFDLIQNRLLLCYLVCISLGAVVYKQVHSDGGLPGRDGARQLLWRSRELC